MCIFRVIIVESKGERVEEWHVGNKGGVDDVVDRRGGEHRDVKESGEANGNDGTKQMLDASAAQDGLKHRECKRVATIRVDREWIKRMQCKRVDTTPSTDVQWWSWWLDCGCHRSSVCQDMITGSLPEHGVGVSCTCASRSDSVDAVGNRSWQSVHAACRHACENGSTIIVYRTSIRRCGTNFVAVEPV